MRFASRAALVTLLVGWATAAKPSLAVADEQQVEELDVVEAREAARAFALKALAKIDAGQFAEGIVLLEQAEASFHAPTHLLYLAQAHAALGHAGLAAQTYDALVREELPNYAPDEFREAERIGKVELGLVERRVGRVKLVLIGTNSTALQVKLDGTVRRIAGDIVYVEPGAHELEVVIDKHARTGRVSVQAGELQQLIFEFGSVQPRVRQGDVGFAAAPPTTGPPYVIPGVIVLSIGGVATVVGALTGVLSFRDVDELSDRCPSRRGCDSADRHLADSARTLGNVSTAMFAIGAAAAVVGVVLVILPAPGDSASKARAMLGPTFVGFEGTF